MNIKNTVKWHYLRTDPNTPGVVAVCTKITDAGKLKMAFAFCSPKDTFVKDIARKKTLGRLESTSGKYVFETDFTGNSFRDATDIFNDAIHPYDKPSWCRNWFINEDGLIQTE